MPASRLHPLLAGYWTSFCPYITCYWSKFKDSDGANWVAHSRGGGLPGDVPSAPIFCLHFTGPRGVNWSAVSPIAHLKPPEAGWSPTSCNNEREAEEVRFGKLQPTPPAGTGSVTTTADGRQAVPVKDTQRHNLRNVRRLGQRQTDKKGFFKQTKNVQNE